MLKTNFFIFVDIAFAIINAVAQRNEVNQL